MININYLAVVAAAIGSMILGAIWYGPLFGKVWMKLMGWGNMSPEQIAEMKKKSGKGYFWMFIGNLVMGYVTAWVIGATGAATLSAGLMTGFWLWLGYIATVSLGGVLWEGKPVKLWKLNNAFNLLNLLMYGAIFALWQ